jgi:hypothetical protein
LNAIEESANVSAPPETEERYYGSSAAPGVFPQIDSFFGGEGLKAPKPFGA